MYIHVHVSAWNTSPHTHTHPHPYPPICHPLRGWTPGISKNSITLELIKIFQFRLKIWNMWIIPHPWMGVWFDEWVGGWVGWWDGSGQNTKNSKNVDWIKIIQFYLKIYDLQRHSIHGWVCGWVVGWMGQWVGSGQMTQNLTKLDLIEIIQFCLKIYDL